MSSSDSLPRLPAQLRHGEEARSTLEAGDDEALWEVVCTRVRPVDAVIELANDDWMKDPSDPLPPGVLVAGGSKDEGVAAITYEVGRVSLENGRSLDPGVQACELTTALCIAAARGHEACVGHLLCHGANPDISPGWRGPLREACLGGHIACAELLLRHCTDPDLLSAEGLAPLHLCRTVASLGCAQALLEHGASVHCAGGASQDTPLHVAAQHGLDEHVRLYLDRGARVDARNGRGETALSTACGAGRRRPEEYERCLRLCALLLQHGAAPDARDEDERSPLHKACSQACLDLAHLLLHHSADATALDYGGASTLGHVLQTAPCAPQSAPERTVQALLKYGSPTVWPDAFPKVLKTCASVPAVMEVLFNSYPQLRLPESWREAIPKEVFQVHWPFYQALFAAARSPRRLQHLCRCAIRRRLGRRCSRLVPQLPLPASLSSYLLLEPEGVLH